MPDPSLTCPCSALQSGVASRRLLPTQNSGEPTFLINISREFQRRKVAHCIISLHSRHPLERDFTAAGVNTLRPATPPRSYEDGISFGLEQLRAFNPMHIIGCLGPQSLEILRYVPKGVSRLGIVQTDDPPVYTMLANYASFLDGHRYLTCPHPPCLHSQSPSEPAI